MNEEHCFQILSTLPDGICVIDDEYRLVFWNKQLERWSGINGDTAIGKKITSLFPRLLEDKYKIRIDQVLTTGTPAIFSSMLHHYLFEFVMPNGQPQPQRVTVTVLQDKDSSSKAVFTIHDMSAHVNQVSAYKKLVQTHEQDLLQHRKLESKNDQLIAAVETAEEAFVIMRITGEIEYINNTFTDQSGWDWEDVQSDSLFWNYQQSSSESSESIQSQVSSGQRWLGRSEMMGKDGSTYSVALKITPIFNKVGIISHAVVIQEDITIQLEFEEQLRRTQKQEALSTLIGGIAHDFNNMLSGMMGHIYLSGREVQDLPKTSERLKKIQGVANDIADIVQQLTTYARKGEIERRKFPLDSFLKEFIKFASHTVPENITFSIDFEKGSFSCQGDVNSLQESLLHVVQNAVDAAVEERESEIKVRLKSFDASEGKKWIKRYPVLRESSFAQITVWDNGVGIPKENLERIFDPFFTTKKIGNGLGLAVTMGNIRKNKGFIDVESSPEGSSFRIWLPLLAEENDLTHAVMQMQHNLDEKAILLVDDESIVRDTTQEILEMQGYQVETAEDGLEAVEKMKVYGEGIDLIIMDMVMPRMVGSVAAKHIRDLYPHIPIIFATAYDQTLSISATKDFDRSILISKPFHPDSLQETIQTLIVGS